MKMKRHIEILDSKELVAEAFCNFLREELKDRASYHIALSGVDLPMHSAARLDDKGARFQNDI